MVGMGWEGGTRCCANFTLVYLLQMLVVVLVRWEERDRQQSILFSVPVSTNKQ